MGYHLFLFFSDPVPAIMVKSVTNTVLERSGLPLTPFYPRSTRQWTYGDLVQVPFQMNRNTGRRSNLFDDLDSFDPASYDSALSFLSLEMVKPVDSNFINALVSNPLG